MVAPEQVVTMIQAEIPDAKVQVNDMTGGGDHLEVIVVSSQFEGRSLVQQHQLVYKSVQGAMDSEAIHALALRTYTPDSWTATRQSA